MLMERRQWDLELVSFFLVADVARLEVARSMRSRRSEEVETMCLEEVVWTRPCCE